MAKEIWVLLRGLIREQAHWQNLIDNLNAKSQGNYTVLALDLPGNGKNFLKTSPLSIAKYTESLRAEIKESFLEKSSNIAVNLICYSLAGSVAIDWATRYPNEIKKVVLINSSLPQICTLSERINIREVLRRFNALIGKDLEQREKAILELVSNQSDRMKNLPEWLNIQQIRPVSRKNLLRQLWAAATFKVPKQLPDNTALILASYGDRLVKCVCSQKLGKFAGWKVVFHENAGHDLVLDAPDWLQKQLFDFMVNEQS